MFFSIKNQQLNSFQTCLMPFNSGPVARDQFYLVLKYHQMVFSLNLFSRLSRSGGGVRPEAPMTSPSISSDTNHIDVCHDNRTRRAQRSSVWALSSPWTWGPSGEPISLISKTTAALVQEGMPPWFNSNCHFLRARACPDV